MVRLFIDEYNRSRIWTYGTPGPGYSSVMPFQKYVAEFVRRNTAAHTELCCSYVFINTASVDMHEDHMILAPFWAPFPLISSLWCVVSKYRSGQLNVWSADKTWHRIPKRNHKCTRYVLNLSPCTPSLNASIKSPLRTLLSGLKNKDKWKQEKVEKHRERRPLLSSSAPTSPPLSRNEKESFKTFLDLDDHLDRHQHVIIGFLLLYGENPENFSQICHTFWSYWRQTLAAT